LKLDLGAGTRKTPGFIGVDVRQFEGVDVVCDLSTQRWPFESDTVDEVICSHMLEHVPGKKVTTAVDVDWVKHTVDVREVVTYPRAHFFNELYRVMKKGAKAQIVTPAWSSGRAYGDPTHEWPPVSEFGFLYLSAEWRKANAPHDDFLSCDFDIGSGYVLHPAVLARNPDYQQHAMSFYKEAAQDIVSTLTKR
jgi:hypothetical protein